MTRAEIEASNARIIADASFEVRVDYTSTDGVTGVYIYDRRDGRVISSHIKVYDHRALFGYDWKDIT